MPMSPLYINPPGRMLTLLCCFLALRTLPEAEPAAAMPPRSVSDISAVDFDKEIRPIFENRCYECHSSQKQKSGLRLDRKSSALKGGDSGKPALIAGKTVESLLIQKITSQDPDE